MDRTAVGFRCGTAKFTLSFSSGQNLQNIPSAMFNQARELFLIHYFCSLVVLSFSLLFVCLNCLSEHSLPASLKRIDDILMMSRPHYDENATSVGE